MRMGVGCNGIRGIVKNMFDDFEWNSMWDGVLDYEKARERFYDFFPWYAKLPSKVIELLEKSNS